MSENIKDALVYAVDLAGKEDKIIQDKTGKEWYDRDKFSLLELETKRYYPESIELTTLTSLVDYFNHNLNKINDITTIVMVKNAQTVHVITENDDRKKKSTLLKVSALVPEFHYGQFYDVENFNIAMQSKFMDSEHRELVIDFASKIVLENSKDIEDNGISQVTTIKEGPASRTKALTPNPVTLQPYRTFQEVTQPASNFIFRLNKQGALALFEADGGAWRIDAMQNTANYLRDKLMQFENVTVLA